MIPQGPDPVDDRPLRPIVQRRLPRPISGHRERVIASFDDVEGGAGGESLQHRCELEWCPERVAAALHEQHRSADGREVGVAPHVRSSGRMQRISEEHQPVDVDFWIGGGDLGRDASAHRLAADDEHLRARDLLAGSGDHRAIAALEQRRAIGQSPVLLGVEEVEGDDVEAEQAEGAGPIDNPGALLTRAGPVRENQRGADAVVFRRVEERRGRGVRGNRDDQLCDQWMSPWMRAGQRATA
jgi:hypothetical protein